MRLKRVFPAWRRNNFCAGDKKDFLLTQSGVEAPAVISLRLLIGRSFGCNLNFRPLPSLATWQKRQTSDEIGEPRIPSLKRHFVRRGVQLCVCLVLRELRIVNEPRFIVMGSVGELCLGVERDWWKSSCINS